MALAGGCPEDKDTKISAVKQSVVRKNPKDLGGDLTGTGYRESLLYDKRGQGKCFPGTIFLSLQKNASDSSMSFVK